MGNKKLCKCGCGQEIENRKSHGKIVMFIHGHNSRGYMKYKNIKKNKHLGYVFGVLCGDGCITNSRHIQLGVCDKDFAEAFQRAVYKMFGFTPNINSYFRKTNFLESGCLVYRVCFNSKELADLYENKFKYYAEKYSRSFIRGFMDSEGSITLRRNNRVSIRAHNTDCDLLLFIKELLKKNKIDCSIRRVGKLKSGKTYFRIHIYNIVEFKNKIGFSISRKQTRLDKVTKNSKRIRHYSLNDYKKVLDLRNNNLTFQEISNITNVNRRVAINWCLLRSRPRLVKFIERET